MTTEQPAHAVYAPSSASRWTQCTASAEAIAALPEQESGEEAEEGTAAHDEIEYCLDDVTDVDTEWDAVTQQAAGFIDSEHPAAYGIALFIAFVRGLPPGRLWVEKRVKLTDKIWGRCDTSHWHAESATLTIIDYKNGFVPVKAKVPQLRIYAAASIFTHNLPAKWIRYVVVQPNDFQGGPPIKQDYESAESLFQFAQTTAAIPDGPKTFVAGEHCRDCILFGLCQPTRDILAHLGAMMGRLATEVPADKIALFEACKKPIEHWFEALRKHGTKLALGGTDVPGMKVVTSNSHRVWLDETWGREFVVQKFGTGALDVPSPAQAEKLGATAEELEGLVHKPPGGPVLASANDKRTPWVRKSAAEMFAAATTSGGK